MLEGEERHPLRRMKSESGDECVYIRFRSCRNIGRCDPGKGVWEEVGLRGGLKRDRERVCLVVREGGPAWSQGERSNMLAVGRGSG